MKVALYLLGLQGLIGAFDTLYYHEWKARLPARGRKAEPELMLHASRDFLYVVLFGTLPWLRWEGAWTVALLAVIAAEIMLTLWDFVVEIAVRKELGDVYAGERVTHALMGILYGAMLAMLVPTLCLNPPQFPVGRASLLPPWALVSSYRASETYMLPWGFRAAHGLGRRVTPTRANDRPPPVRHRHPPRPVIQSSTVRCL